VLRKEDASGNKVDSDYKETKEIKRMRSLLTEYNCFPSAKSVPFCVKS